MKTPAPSSLHVIFGAGPVGCWTARALRDLNIPVRAINRSGRRPDLMPAEVEMVAADASDAVEAKAAAQGAAVVYQALNPPYHQWHQFFPGLQAAALSAAASVGARYVSIENLYMYDSSKPMTEESPIAPRSKKGALRARMAQEVFAAQRRGELRVAALRSSDYFGPGVFLSALGERVCGSLVKGKKAQLLGSATVPHSFAYIEDVGRAAATLGTREEALGKVWIAPHAPACTQGEMVEKASRVLGVNPQYSVVSPLMLRLVGLFSPGAGESVEMMYEFTEPFDVDSRRIQRVFALEPTPVDDAIRRTMEWYRKSAARSPVDG
jgi:nucleoside-diphosphate-sugar epimerase